MDIKPSLRGLIVIRVAFAIALFACPNFASAQDIFGGRGIRSQGTSTDSMFKSQSAGAAEPRSSSPFAGLFKKPAFLSNGSAPKFELKMPQFDFFKKLAPPSFGNSGEQKSLFSGLPKLPSLFPQRAPGEPSMLQKMKTKTDSFFERAFAFEGLMPGRNRDSEPQWDEVRKTYEQIQAEANVKRQPLSPPVRSAQTPTGQTQRF